MYQQCNTPASNAEVQASLNPSDDSLTGIEDSSAETRGQTRNWTAGLRRVVQPVLLLSAGAVIGVIAYRNMQDRQTPPATTPVKDTLQLYQDDIPPGKVPYGGGFVVLSDHSCYAASCSTGSTCCKNDQGHGYCCSASNFCYDNGCNTQNVINRNKYCFAGEARVDVQGKGSTAMQDLLVGDNVLVKQAGASLTYEPVLAFLHATGTVESTNYLMVSYAGGQLRASPNHIVFLADGSEKLVADIIVGDELAVAQGSGKVSAVVSTSGTTGMYAPMTSSGTIVVDGVIASNYATHSSTAWIPHTAIHAAFFPLRMYYALGFGSDSKADMGSFSNGVDGVHPFAAFLDQHVKAPAFKLFNIK